MKAQKWFIVILIVSLVFTLTACGGAQTDADESTAAETERTVAEADETTEAVSESNEVASDWTTGTIEGSIEITGVVEFAGGLIGTNSMAVYYSADGISWELTKDLSPYPFYAIFPVGGQMVVYDANNAHVTSDGKTWSSSPREDSYLFEAVMHDGTQYIKADTSQLYISEDGGKFWPVQSDPSNPLTRVFFLDEENKPTNVAKLAKYDGIYYAAGPGLWTSTDVYNWTKVVTMNDMTYGAEDLLYNGSVLFMPAYYENYIYDGSGITRVNPIGNTFLVHDGKFIAVSGNGASSTSIDGITWEPLFNEDATSFRAYAAVVFDGNLFAYGEDGQYRYAKLSE